VVFMQCSHCHTITEIIFHLLLTRYVDLNLHEKSIWLKGENFSIVSYFYNFNLLIINLNFENSKNTVGLAFKKPSRKFRAVFF